LRWIFRGSFFLSPVSAREAGTGAYGRGHSEAIVHDASLLQFLIVSNQLSPDPVEPADLALSDSDAWGQALLQEPRHEQAAQRRRFAVR
jgi:hypothetical protein